MNQNLCAPIERTESGVYDGRQFRVQSDPVDLGQIFDWANWELFGQLHAVDRNLTDVGMKATFDVRDIAEELGWGVEICDALAEDRDIHCFPCGNARCVQLIVTGLQVGQAGETFIEPINLDDVEANENCQ